MFEINIQSSVFTNIFAFSGCLFYMIFNAQPTINIFTLTKSEISVDSNFSTPIFKKIIGQFFSSDLDALFSEFSLINFKYVNFISQQNFFHDIDYFPVLKLENVNMLLESSVFQDISFYIESAISLIRGQVHI